MKNHKETATVASKLLLFVGQEMSKPDNKIIQFDQTFRRHRLSQWQKC